MRFSAQQRNKILQAIPRLAKNYNKNTLLAIESIALHANLDEREIEVFVNLIRDIAYPFDKQTCQFRYTFEGLCRRSRELLELVERYNSQFSLAV